MTDTSGFERNYRIEDFIVFAGERTDFNEATNQTDTSVTLRFKNFYNLVVEWNEGFQHWQTVAERRAGNNRIRVEVNRAEEVFRLIDFGFEEFTRRTLDTIV